MGLHKGMDGSPILVSKAQAAEWLGISRQALDKRPDLIVLSGSKVDLKATVTAYCAHIRGVASGRGGEEQVLDLTKERARLAKEQADEKEIKNAVLRGDLLPARDVEATWADFLRGLRSRMLALPSRAQVSAGLTQAQTLAVDRELRLALAEAGEDADG